MRIKRACVNSTIAIKFFWQFYKDLQIIIEGIKTIIISVQVAQLLIMNSLNNIHIEVHQEVILEWVGEDPTVVHPDFLVLRNKVRLNRSIVEAISRIQTILRGVHSEATEVEEDQIIDIHFLHSLKIEVMLEMDTFIQKCLKTPGRI